MCYLKKQYSRNNTLFCMYYSNTKKIRRYNIYDVLNINEQKKSYIKCL